MLNKIIKMFAFCLVFMLASHTIAFSSDKSLADKHEKPYKVCNFFSRGLQNISGLNFFATKLAESKIKKHLKKYANGEVDIDIDSFSAIDLASGKLKKLEVEANEVFFEDVFISSLQAQSKGELIYIDYKSKPVKLVEPLDISFKGTITQEDLNKTVNSQNYQEKISSIKVNGNAIQFLKFFNPKVELSDNRMILSTDLQIAGMPVNIPVKIDSDLKVIDNKVQFSDVKFQSSGLELSFPTSVYENINPVLYNLDKFETNGKKLNFNQVAVNNGQINIEGSLWLPKSKDKTTINSN